MFGRKSSRSRKRKAAAKARSQAKYGPTPVLPKSVANYKLPKNKYGFGTPKGQPKASPKKKGK